MATNTNKASDVLRAVQEFSTNTFETEYAAYRSALDLRVTGLQIERCEDQALVESIAGKLSGLSGVITKIAQEAKASYAEVVAILKERTAFSIFKAFGYSIKKIWQALNAAMDAYADGLLAVFEKIHKTKPIQHVHHDVEEVDEILEKHPICKRAVGVTLAGIILLGWTQMTFLGALKYDFDFSKLGAAIAGKYSLAEFLTSKSGIMYITLVGTGAILGLSVPWLGSTLYNFAFGLLYTLVRYAGQSGLAKRMYDALIRRIRKGESEPDLKIESWSERIITRLNEAKNGALEEGDLVQSIETVIETFREIVEAETDIDHSANVKAVSQSEAGETFKECVAIRETRLYFPINLLASHDFIVMPNDVETALNGYKSSLYAEMKSRLVKAKVEIPADAQEPLSAENLVELGAGDAAIAFTQIRDDLEMSRGVEIRVRIGARKQAQGVVEIIGDVMHSVGDFDSRETEFVTEPVTFKHAGNASTVKQLANLIQLALDQGVEVAYTIDQNARDLYDSEADSALDLINQEIDATD